MRADTLRQALIRHGNTFLAPVGRNVINELNPFMYPPSESVNIGEFRDVVRGGSSTLSISISGELESPRPATEIGHVQAALEVRVDDNSLVHHEGDLQGRFGQLKWTFMGPMQESKDVRFSMPNPPHGTLTFGTIRDFALLQIRSAQSPPGSPPEAHTKLFEIGGTLLGIPTQFLNSLHSVFALRGFEEWGSPLPQERLQSFERLSLPDRAVALVTNIASNARLKKEVSNRLSELLNIGVDIEFVGSNRVKVFALEENGGDGQRHFVNEGTGASQLPFILVPIVLTPRNETVLLSEPEVHLHPKKQCELTRMLLTVAKKENIQFFIETHSEHVLHTILNAVALGEWSPADVALYYFAEPKNGIAEVGRREINQFGQVDGGLPSFFDQSLAELTDYLKALSKT